MRTSTHLDRPTPLASPDDGRRGVLRGHGRYSLCLRGLVSDSLFVPATRATLRAVSFHGRESTKDSSLPDNNSPARSRQCTSRQPRTRCACTLSVSSVYKVALNFKRTPQSPERGGGRKLERRSYYRSGMKLMLRSLQGLKLPFDPGG